MKAYCRGLIFAEVPITYDAGATPSGAARSASPSSTSAGSSAGASREIYGEGEPLPRDHVDRRADAGLRALAAAARRTPTSSSSATRRSPADFELAGCDYYGLEQQRRLPFELAAVCPTRHYARKNIGYLLAAQRGAPMIVETDDDTVAYGRFWEPRERRSTAAVGRPEHGWVNVYRYFSTANIWPRGLPLDQARAPFRRPRSLPGEGVPARSSRGSSTTIRTSTPSTACSSRAPPASSRAEPLRCPGAWCPFNSQNTTWWPEAFPLMYLPAYCSFRMTDIWRASSRNGSPG